MNSICSGMLVFMKFAINELFKEIIKYWAMRNSPLNVVLVRSQVYECLSDCLFYS